MNLTKPFPIESTGLDRHDRINTIESTRSNRLQKWLIGQILSCLDLLGLNLATSKFNEYLFVIFVKSDFSKF